VITIEVQAHPRMIGVRHVMPYPLVVHGRDVLDLPLDEIQDLVDDVRPPVEERAAGDTRVRMPVVARVSVVPDEGLEVEDLTECTLTGQPADGQEVGVEASILVHDELALRTARVVHKVIALLRRQGHRLLDDDVQASIQGLVSPSGMAVGWSGDDDDVQVRVGQKVARIGMLGQSRLLAQGGGHARRIEVAHGTKRQPGGLAHGASMLCTNGAVATASNSRNRGSCQAGESSLRATTSEPRAVCATSPCSVIP
jgi:hypothetical protein